MSKRALITLTIILIVAIAMASCINLGAEPAPAPPPKYVETEFAVVPGEVYRLNIYSNHRSRIEGSWKADVPIYMWFIPPNSLSGVGRVGESATMSVDLPPYEQPYSQYSHGRILPAYGYHFDKLDAEEGYYTLCFMVIDSDGKLAEPVGVILRYRVR